MGEIVVGAGTSHAPTIPFLAERNDPEQASRFYAGLEKIREAFAEAKPDIIIEFSNDHWNTFYLGNMPSICVGIAAEHFGPVEPNLKIAQGMIPGHRPLALELVREAYRSGFDLSFSEELLLDHGSVIPLHYLHCLDVPVVPILVNNLLDPMPSARRLYQLGRLVRQVVASRPKGERVALLGTGGLSHSPGDPGPQLNVPYDEWFLAEVEKGKGDALAEQTNGEIWKGGSGMHELKNWIAVMGALVGLKGEVTTYEGIGQIGHGAVLWRF